MSNDGYHIPPPSTDPFEYTMAEAIYGWRSRDLDFLEREEAVYQAVHNASRAITNGLSTPQDSERSNGQAQSNNTNDSNKERRFPPLSYCANGKAKLSCSRDSSSSWQTLVQSWIRTS